MHDNIILAGVGGQGILSISAVLALGALSKGLFVKQSEVHGMSQRGGAVLSHIRISDLEIQSVLIPNGKANALISVEPMETLRYYNYLSPDGIMISNTDPYESDNYPDLESIMIELNKLPNRILLDASKLALKAGNKKSANMVVLGAASPYLNLGEEAILEGMMAFFSPKGERVISVNMDAFNFGRDFALNEIQKK
ncbi:MAG: indolepyruvate oxidoreductase subunit beta [Deltaproteobacteria bacterium]